VVADKLDLDIDFGLDIDIDFGLDIDIDLDIHKY
jgi:hypothetical protein